jgi:hypothetical protein
VAILTRDTGNRSDRITSCLPIIWDRLSRDGPEAQRSHVSFNGSSSAALGNTIYGIANIVIETASRTVAQNVNIIREALPKP